jgi:hypothetical protein
MREYVEARLVEIRERLAYIDARQDARAYHDLRKRLVSEGVELMALLATDGEQETPAVH